MIEKKRFVSHPGTYIKDAIDELGISQSEFAFRSGLTIKNVSTLLNGESNITFDVALKLAGFFHNSVEGWINLQTKYNLFLNERNKEQEYRDDWSIVKYIDKNFCSNYLKITIDSKNKNKTIDDLRKCFNVVSLQNLKNVDLYAFCRTSVSKDINEKTIILRNAWISLADQEARKISCSEFNKDKILSNLKYLRSFTLKGPKVINTELKDFLRSCGIKLIVLPFLPGSNISGVTKWISSENCVMVAINDYGKDADKIWFSLFHEIGHAIKNHKRHLTISYSKNNIEDKEEKEANEFAKNALIDKDEYQKFIKLNKFTISNIRLFSKQQNVASFIVVGRLQSDGIISWDKYNEEKPSYKINI